MRVFNDLAMKKCLPISLRGLHLESPIIMGQKKIFFFFYVLDPRNTKSVEKKIGPHITFSMKILNGPMSKNGPKKKVRNFWVSPGITNPRKCAAGKKRHRHVIPDVSAGQKNGKQERPLRA